jgi:hypothetical protein
MKAEGGRMNELNLFHPSSFILHQSLMSNYVFPGLWPFIERVAQGRDIYHLGRARDIWHCKQIQDSLGQLPRLDAKSQRELLGHVLKIRASLAVALEGIDAAVLEVSYEFNLVSSPGQEQDETLQVGLSAPEVQRKHKKGTSDSSLRSAD